MSKSVDVILSAVKSAGEAALRLHDENETLQRERDEAVALIDEAKWLLSHAITRETVAEWTRRRDDFLAKMRAKPTGSLSGNCKCGSDGSLYAPCVCGGAKP